jgi:hypothetical protein
MTVGIRCADHTTPSIGKSWYYFANKRRSVGIVRSRTKATEFSLVYRLYVFEDTPSVVGYSTLYLGITTELKITFQVAYFIQQILSFSEYGGSSIVKTLN